MKSIMEVIQQWRDLVYSKHSGVRQVDIKYPKIIKLAIDKRSEECQDAIIEVKLVTDKKNFKKGA